MAAEKAEMDDTVRAAAIAHRYGMKADTYVQWNTLMYETFFAEEPRAKDWVQRDALWPADHAQLRLSAIVPLPPLFCQPGLSRLFEEGRPVCR